MESLDELLQQAEAAHGHMCAGQILGVRMALLGLNRLGIESLMVGDCLAPRTALEAVFEGHQAALRL